MVRTIRNALQYTKSAMVNKYRSIKRPPMVARLPRLGIGGVWSAILILLWVGNSMYSKWGRSSAAVQHAAGTVGATRRRSVGILIRRLVRSNAGVAKEAACSKYFLYFVRH